jgi:hypothetical protein
VTDRDAQSGFGGEGSEMNFPGSEPVAVRAAGVRGDQQSIRVG